VKRRCSLTLALIFLVTVPTTAVRAEEQQTDAQSQQLLQKHRAYVGWQFGDGTFRTMRVTSTVTDKKGDKLEDVAFSSAGLAFHETDTMLKQSSVTLHSGFTGSVFWQSFENGFTMPIYGEAAKMMASYTMLMQEGTSGLPGTFQGNKNVDGKSYPVVRVTMVFGDPIDLYIDPATGAYVKAVIDPDGPSEAAYHIVTYGDVVSGKKMIGSYRIDDSDELNTNVKFEPNADVTAEELHPPKATASWTFASDQPVPITLTHDRVLVDATVNGVKGTFILDTGADSIYLNDNFADRAKVQVLKGTADVASVYGTTKDRLRKADTINFGSATLQNVLVYSENFESGDSSGLDANGYAGLIGTDFFAGAIVKLNVYDSTMSILDPSTDLSAMKGLPIFVDLSDGKLTVPMTLDSSTKVNAILDTGNPDDILFSDKLANKRSFNPTMLTLGPIQYMIGTWEPCCVGGNYALLGFDFLKHFDFVFDYPHGRMFLTPNKN
jgi:hypothetical protein